MSGAGLTFGLADRVLKRAVGTVPDRSALMTLLTIERGIVGVRCLTLGTLPATAHFRIAPLDRH